MRNSILTTTIAALSAVTAFAGCSGGSALAPKPSVPQESVQRFFDRVPAAVAPMTLLKVNMHVRNHLKSFNACPATGQIEYISDFNNNSISIFAGNFHGQTACGMLTGADGLLNPQGLMVKNGDLYVANTGGSDILAFHRGETSAFKTYTDTINGSQFPVDVTVSSDNTVIASNIFGSNEAGSLSTWNKTTGASIGNFVNPNGANTYFLTVQKNGTVYYDDNTFGLYVGSCPAGVCGSFAATGATVAFPGGIRSADREDVVQQDQSGPGGGDAIVYESFPNGTSCALNGSDPVTFDINHSQHHYFFTDSGFNEGVEVKDPATDGNNCSLIGIVPGNSGGLGIGMAIDRPESLH